MNIDELQAGRELDRLVEFALYEPTLILDDEGKPDALRWRRKTGEAVNAFVMPYHSTDIAAAWQVVEALRTRYGLVELSLDHDVAVVTVGQFYEASADTAPLAVCRAALKAVQQ